ncbi:hypothetical protein PG996_002016 [Apiospora saccharicola]|uniref:Uncharacterized protein n=1 Tax=Apiospora saccharicola TaxID=335842 RepID=A0ABR1WIA1_9PEZI
MAAQIYTSRVSSMLLFVLCYVLPLAAAAAIGAHGNSSQPVFPELAKRDMDVGSSCSEEGQWNCMGSSWQRCAAGRWSSVVQCAPGTHCTPNGLTDDMDAENGTDSSDNSSDSSDGSSTSGGRPTSAHPQQEFWAVTRGGESGRW